jgi:hypothetical protein
MRAVMATKENIRAALCCMRDGWQMQSNYLDSGTKFIYTCNSVDEIKDCCKQYNIDLNYALHRWYNFNCAKVHEDIFIKKGAEKEPDAYHKTIDFYLFNVPFDLKTTYFPKAIKNKADYDLTSRKGKNNLIVWFYANQSKQGRYHLENRLFIVCENLESKSNFEVIEERVNRFIDFSKEAGFNQVLIENKNVCSDVIWIPT